MVNKKKWPKCSDFIRLRKADKPDWYLCQELIQADNKEVHISLCVAGDQLIINVTPKDKSKSEVQYLIFGDELIKTVYETWRREHY